MVAFMISTLLIASLGWTGVSGYSTSVTTIPETTVTLRRTTKTVDGAVTTIRPTTVTLEPQTRTVYDIPLDIIDADVDVLQALGIYATTITSIDSEKESQLESAFSSFKSEFTKTRPFPSVISDFPQALAERLDYENPAEEAAYYSIIVRLDAWTTSTDRALETLLSPYPSLSSEAREFLSVVRTYRAEEFQSWGSIVSSILTLTGPPPTDATVFAAALGRSTGSSPAPTDGSVSTSSSTAAAPSSAPSNAVLMAVGVAGLAAAGMGLQVLL